MQHPWGACHSQRLLLKGLGQGGDEVAQKPARFDPPSYLVYNQTLPIQGPFSFSVCWMMIFMFITLISCNDDGDRRQRKSIL